MLRFKVSKLKTTVVFLVVLLVFSSSSWAQDDDNDVVFVENLTEQELQEEVVSDSSKTEQPPSEPEKMQMDHVQTEIESFENEETEVVQTTGGPIIGSTQKSSEGVEVSVYYGIPYAAAPVGPLRFRPPVRISPWKTTLVAKKPVPLCFQEFKPVKGMEWVKSILGRPWTEDCLTISVWAPKPKAQGAPILVNIHGGAFVIGSSTMLTDGTALASKGVVVMSLSYRLGVFGFFNLGHPEAPGNVGLMDQTLALQWVQENAAVFGGDPSRVTLIGVSAGGASVGYHLLSPMSKGLFSAAIVMGGSPTNPWAIKEAERAIKKSNDLLSTLGCSHSNVNQSMECLRGRSAEDIRELAVSPELITSESFIPTVDGQFITEHPEVYFEAGRIANPVPVIIGTSENEGSIFIGFNLQNNDRVFRRTFEELIRKMDKDLTPLQVKALDVLYTNWSNPDDSFLLRESVRDLYGDHLIVCGVNKLSYALSGTGSNVYRYVFGHTFGFGPIQLPSWMGTPHGSEIVPILGQESSSGPNAEHAIVTEDFRRRIINFLKTRNPNQNSEGITEKVFWPQYNLRDQNYFHVAANSHVRSVPRTRECRILDELLPVLASVDKSC